MKLNEAMRYLNSSETKVQGPTTVSIQLEKPAQEFEDVKVIAYPVPRDYQLKLDNTNSQIKVSPALEGVAKIFDSNKVDGMGLPTNVEVRIDFAANDQFTARSLTIYPAHTYIIWKIKIKCNRNRFF